MAYSKHLNSIWYRFSKYILVYIPDSYFYQLANFVNYKRLGFNWRKLNLKNPKTFNEKLNYLKLHNRNPLGQEVADKVAVREYVKETVGEKYLIKSLGVYESANEIDFSSLPNQFVLKANHGSGWNIVCKDKSSLDLKDARYKLDKWLNLNAYYDSREWQYRNIKPQILCEEMLRYEIEDLKFFCFNGEPKLIQVDQGRFTNHKRSIYTINWEKTNIQIRYEPITDVIPRPDLMEEMIEVSRKLSKPFDFCRVDLYELSGAIFFGEITLHPGGGKEPFLNRKDDEYMGSLINLQTTG